MERKIESKIKPVDTKQRGGGDQMKEVLKKWSTDQIVEAFIHFRNPQIEADRQEIERLLRECLKGFDENEFDSGHVMSVAIKSVPLKNVSEFAALIVPWLEENSPPSTA